MGGSLRRDNAAFGFAGVRRRLPGAVGDLPNDPIGGGYPRVCTEIVLAAETFEESVTIARDLEMRGASSTTTVIEGRVVVQGAGTQVTLQDPKLDASAAGVAGSFTEALLAEGGAEVNGLRIEVVNAMIDLWTIFTDDFESGDTSAWSSSVP